MKTSFFHGAGNAMSFAHFAIPLAYMLKFKTKNNSELVVMEMTKNTVSYSFRSTKTMRIGMLRYAKVEHDQRGSFFMVEGKRVELSKASVVI